MIAYVKKIQNSVLKALWYHIKADLNNENNVISEYIEALKIQEDPNNGASCRTYVYIFAACTTNNKASIFDLNLSENSY